MEDFNNRLSKIIEENANLIYFKKDSKYDLDSDIVLKKIMNTAKEEKEIYFIKNNNKYTYIDTIIDFSKFFTLEPFLICNMFDKTFSVKNGEFIWELVEEIKYDFSKKNNIENLSFLLEIVDKKLNLYFKNI
jgi:predicted DNA binding protein